ncbi:MAG TPA: T4 RnlA family RNA ligase [Candidatus Obscuribacter sp.]|nr:T4 RnlA family RNA ligase [Candidatus Obscuribacter sp.]
MNSLNARRNRATGADPVMLEALNHLKVFIRALVSARVKSDEGFRRWKSEPANEKLMADCFGYERLPGMPPVTAVCKPFFHPELPLIGLNYTPVAHNTLHKFPSGWTPVLRLCRGIVFSRRASLVALPFEKFFNYGEHAETSDLQVLAQPFTATLKQDGHLAIIFQFQGKLLGTTRGSFLSASSLIANRMLSERSAHWLQPGVLDPDLTLLCELIHPETHVIVDYGDREDFILLGARHRRSLEDLEYDRLEDLSRRLNLELTRRWQGKGLAELLELVKEPTYHNEEGFVVRFADGRRVKFKYAGYVSLMLGEKLTHRYVMMRLMDGSFDSRFADLDAEVQTLAEKLKDELMKAASLSGKRKDKRAYLLGLVPPEECTAYHKTVCGKFLTWLEAQGVAA